MTEHTRPKSSAETAALGSAHAGPVAGWQVYLVRAANGALYCGITTDPQRRLAEHRAGKGARFFHSSPALAMVYLEACASKPVALRREYAIKQLSKAAKEQLVAEYRRQQTDISGDSIHE